MFHRWRVRERVEELLTGAGSLIGQQRESTVAAALVAALRVGAERLTAAVLDGALVDVWRRSQNTVFQASDDPSKNERNEQLLSSTHPHTPICSRWICSPCHRSTGSGRSC